MKKLYMRTIIGFSERDWVLIILFQFYGTKAGLFDGDLLQVGQYESLNLHTGRKTTPVLVYNLSNLSKIIPRQKTADIVLWMLMSLAFLQQIKVKIFKTLTK